MSTKNYVLSVLALLLVLASGASALVINTPTTWTGTMIDGKLRVRIHDQTDNQVQINVGGSVTVNPNVRVELNGVATPAATKLILNGGTFTHPGTGADGCVHLPDNATPYPVYIVLNSGTCSISELRPDLSREHRIQVGAGTLFVYNGYNPYSFIGASGYYRPNGTFTAGTGNGWLAPQTGYKLFVEELGGNDYKIYGVSAIYGENPTDNAVVIDRELPSVCFNSLDIEAAKVYFGKADVDEFDDYKTSLTLLGTIKTLNPSGTQNTCMSIAAFHPLDPNTLADPDIYSWVVEGYDLFEGEPNNLLEVRGYQFIVAAAPVIKVQPTGQSVFGGETATFTAEVDSFQAPTGTWYKVSDTGKVNPIAGTSTNLGNFRHRLTLTLNNVQWGDQDSYYCTVANSDGSVDTASVRLWFKTEMARWTFGATTTPTLNDTGTKANGYTENYDGTARSGTGDGDPVTPTIVAGGGLDADAMVFNGTATGVFVDLKDGFADFTGGLTVSVWAYMDTAASTSVRYFDFAQSQAVSTDPLNAVNLARGNAQSKASLLFRCGSGQNATITWPTTIVTNTWQHFVATMTATGAAQLYVDGFPTQSGSVAEKALNVTRTLNFIGRENPGLGGTELHRFKGKIGDMRIYNYAISADDVANLYTTLAVSSYCRNKPARDWTGTDCIVGTSDLLEAVSQWLDCGLWPSSACP